MQLVMKFPHLKVDENLQMGSDDPCPEYTSHMNDNDEFRVALVSSSNDRKYSFQGLLSLQWGSFPIICLGVCLHT